MPEPSARARLETKSLVVGYAMSRLDAEYLAARKQGTWRQAYAEAAQALGVPPATLKNLRDEFDPVHPNPRRGWHQRPLRADRQRVIDELEEVSTDALAELIARILRKDEEATAEAIDSLAATTRVAQNVAERLLTGRRAEEYFLAHSNRLVSLDPSDILDLRQAALGFDFGVSSQPRTAIEVKGLKQSRGGIQFTDREWCEAKYRQSDYWLVVVGNLVAEPMARVIRDPHSALSAHCAYQRSVAAVWRSTVCINDG